MLRKLFPIGMLFLLALLFAGSGCNGGGGAIPEMQTDRVAYVGIVPFEPPLLYQKAGELVGPDAELAKRIVERVDATRETKGGSPVKLTWINRTYSTLSESLGEVHFVLGVFGITEERKKTMDFSDPYYTSELVLITNPPQKDIDSTQLEGARIGVRKGTAVEEFVTRKYKGSAVKLYETLDNAILGLRSSEVDAVIDDKNMAAYALMTTPGAGFMEYVTGPGEVLGTFDCAIAVRKGDQALLKVANDIIADMKQEGKLSALLSEHLSDKIQLIEKRRQDRLVMKQKAEEPRKVQIRVGRERGYDFDIYRMANLRFRFRNNATGKAFSTSPVRFQGSTGIASTALSPAKYTLIQSKFNFSYPVEILPTDGKNVTFTITVGRSGVSVSSRSR